MKGAPISWRKWMSGSYQSCGGKFLRWTNQICGLSSRSSIGRPLAHIMSSEMMADCGWLDPWQQQRRNAECSNGRGPVSRKRWGSGTYMSYMCHKFVIYMLHIDHRYVSSGIFRRGRRPVETELLWPAMVVVKYFSNVAVCWSPASRRVVVGWWTQNVGRWLLDADGPKMCPPPRSSKGTTRYAHEMDNMWRKHATPW